MKERKFESTIKSGNFDSDDEDFWEVSGDHGSGDWLREDMVTTTESQRLATKRTTTATTTTTKRRG